MKFLPGPPPNPLRPVGFKKESNCMKKKMTGNNFVSITDDHEVLLDDDDDDDDLFL